jgi:hypothetical protein
VLKISFLFLFGILKVNDENSRIRIQDPDPLVRGMEPRIRIRIHPKMSWIRNTGSNNDGYASGLLETLRTTKARTRQATEPLNLVQNYGEKKQFQCESGIAMEQAVQRNQRSKKCPAVQKIAEGTSGNSRMQRKKNRMKNNPRSYRAQHGRFEEQLRRTTRHVRMSSSSNNVFNMRLDGALGIPLQ